MRIIDNNEFLAYAQPEECVCQADHKLDDTEDLYLKPNSSVRLVGQHVVKQFNAMEASAYEQLPLHANELSNGSPRIKIPEIIHQDRESGVTVMTQAATFPNLSPVEYFGDWKRFDRKSFSMYLGVFSVLSSLPLPNSKQTTSEDYERRTAFGISSIDYLARQVHDQLDPKTLSLFAKVSDIAEASQPHIEDLPQLTAHRDPNPNNYALCAEHDTATIVDWETFGAARRGYDEGRLSSHLALTPEARQEYSELAIKALPEENAIYFWRVAMMRSFRELTFFSNGHYDERLEKASCAQPPVRTFTEALYGTVEHCIDEIEASL